MKNFSLKFERYVQEAAWVNVKAISLAEAMAMAAQVDTDELDWEIEGTDPTDARLYGVVEGRIEKGNWVARVELEHVFGVPTWFSEDLCDQWGNTAFEARKTRARQFARIEFDEWMRLQESLSAASDFSKEQAA